MLVGYVLVFSYILFISYVLGPVILRLSNGETSRKCIHILLFFVWILMDRYHRGTVHQVLLPASFILLNLLSYRFGLCKSIERREGNHFGTVYFAIAITVMMGLSYVFPSLYLPGGVAVMCLTFGDGFAALIGYNFPSRRIAEHKSLLGFLAAAAASAGAVLVFNRGYGVGLTTGEVLLLGLLTAILELTDRGLDNFTIPFGVFLLSWGFLRCPAGSLALGTAVGEAAFLVLFFTRRLGYSRALGVLGAAVALSLLV